MDSKALITKQYLDNGIKNDWNKWLRTVKITDENQAVAFHNSFPGGKDITSYVTDGTLWKRIAGTDGFSLFEGLFPGDYIKMTEKIRSRQDNNGTSQTNEGTDYVMIAGFDSLMGNGDNNGTVGNVTYHHLVMIPGKPDASTMNAFGQHRMNATDTTANGYSGSQLATTVLGSPVSTGKRFSSNPTASINEQLYAEFGSHLATIRELVSSDMISTRICGWGDANGNASARSWGSYQSILMSEAEVYGCQLATFGTDNNGTQKTQLPVFRYFPYAINNRTSWYWLTGIASSADFCGCNNNGYASDHDASSSDSFVRPRFVLKA